MTKLERERKRSQNARPSRHGVKSFAQASGARRTEGELCAAAGAGRTRAAEGNNRQENFSPLKSDEPHFSFREKSWRACVFEGSITSAVVVASIDHFIPSLQRQTVLVMDNASIHKSFEFQENIERWQQQGLTIVNIAPYSPELNIIEIVWRKIKYEWMPFSAYESFRNLKESLFDILANIGKSYTVNFA